MDAEFFLAGMKQKWDEGAEEYCWAITQEAERSCCGRSSSSVTQFVFQPDSLVYAHTVVRLYSQIRPAHKSSCAQPYVRLKSRGVCAYIIYLLTNLLTSLRRVLLEMPTDS